jgi:hypothetical protein
MSPLHRARSTALHILTEPASLPKCIETVKGCSVLA